MLPVAASIAMQSDLFLVVGTSMVVYPAASLIHYTPVTTPRFIVDPKIPELGGIDNLTKIRDKASTGMERLKEILLEEYV